MKDIPTYLRKPYKKDLETVVKEISTLDNNRVQVVLEDTVFYPHGGGQPCDQGEIIGISGSVDVSEVKYLDGTIVHIGKIQGEIEKGNKVRCKIDWNRRYKNMIIHTAGHLVDEVLAKKNLSPDKLKPLKAEHGNDAYIEYALQDKDIEIDKKELEEEIEQMIQDDLDISWDFVETADDLKEKSRFTTAHIPKNKPLRIVSFGDEKGIPDGGTMVKTTKEIPKISIDDIEKKDEKVRISYSVILQEQKEDKEGKNQLKDDLSKNDLLDRFEQVRQVYKEMLKDLDVADKTSEELQKKYLGKKGEVKKLLRQIGKQEPEIRADFGAAVNILQQKVEQELEILQKREERQRLGKSLTKESIDVTAPFAPNISKSERPELIAKPGSLHPITQIGEKALDVFRTMGFHVTEARRLDDDYNVFEALNIPKGHPARDMWDTFWTENGLIPITHTSSMQNRIISGEDMPIREVIVGRCFRNEATDASHEHTFYQVEGVYVDEDIKLSDLIGTLSNFMNTFYGQEIKYRIQPSYFPFVEPGLEFMIECLVCGQSGCPFCGYSGWVEVIPCGMIHPNVLKEAGRDPEKYSGFAWGLGYDRLVMLGSQIQDIRNIHSGDLKFLEQFK